MPNLTEGPKNRLRSSIKFWTELFPWTSAGLVSDYMEKEKLELPNMLLLNSHGKFWSVPGETGTEGP